MGSPRESPRPPADDPIDQLKNLQSILTDLLGPVDDDARRMDASSKDAHKHVVAVCAIVKQDVFGSGGLLDQIGRTHV